MQNFSAYLFVFALCGFNASAQKLREQYPWYHLGDEIHSELDELSRDCAGVQFEFTTQSLKNRNDEDVTLDVVRISQGSSEGKQKAFFVFGEHARELISPETGLSFVRTLCGQGDPGNQDQVARVLGNTTFVILPNANPVSRKEVEFGKYCKRTNEENVDLNRNFGDAHHDASIAKDDEMNPGPKGFSEPESQIIKNLVLAEKPEIFLSVHSGAYLLGTPYGYTDKDKVDNEQHMLQVLKPISEQACNGGCPFGDLAGMIGYKSMGCDIDYVKETLNTPYVFTWEIYTGSDVRQYYEEEAHARTEKRPMNKETSDFFWAKSLGLLQTSAVKRQENLRGRNRALVPEDEQNVDDCFDQFNPKSQSETESTTAAWTKAFLTLCDEVAILSGGGSLGDSSKVRSAKNSSEPSASNSAVDASTQNQDQPLDFASTLAEAKSMNPSQGMQKSLSALDTWANLATTKLY
eukprot:gnl/MRDRNA2_/MRDRNA2_106236_c0_seq1.p1 gnl/MRDRNA2_/MRDRNA2_106236_c0~~gnl/MRDRNA2_/MRDRNA2_106236_c0_seq1.p1  ORF type:complete len:463 (+),score=93.44 gnl/MRDRNA2_/MRDRNA2_106236_c0_seq1:164-1552(+)